MKEKALEVYKKISDKSLYGFALQYGKSDSVIGSDGTSVDSENYNFSWYGSKPQRAFPVSLCA